MIFNLTMPTPYYATIVVSATTGSTVTCTYTDGMVYRANEVSGKWTFKVKKQGSYTIRGVLGSKVATSTVSVQERKTYNVTLTYVTYVTYRIFGNGVYTGSGTASGKTVATAGGFATAGTHTVALGSTIPLVIKSTAGGVGTITVDGTVVARTGVGTSSKTYNLRINSSGVYITLRAEGTSRGAWGVITVTTT